MTDTSGTKRPMTAEDLYSMEQILNFDVSPDGRSVVYTLQWVDRDSEKKHSNLWHIDLASGKQTRFTSGNQSDFGPRFSPDGSTIAFMSNRADTKMPPQLYLLPVFGGEARPASAELKGMVLDYRWSPDGKSLALAFKKIDPHMLEWEADPKKKELGLINRHIKRAFFRAEGLGYLTQEAVHIWTLDVESGEATQLTDGEYNEGQPVWSPDGQNILYLSNPDPDWDIKQGTSHLFSIPVTGGEGTKLETAGFDIQSVGFSPDGSKLAYRGRLVQGEWWRNSRLFVADADGSNGRCITEQHDIDFGSSSMGDFGSPPNQSPVIWSKDGSAIYSTVSHRGASPLYKVSIEDGTIEPVVDDGRVVGEIAFDEAHSKLIYFRAEEFDPCQLWSLDTSSGEAAQLTQINRPLFDEIDFGHLEEVWFEGDAGNELHGWILTPPGFDETQRYPAVLYIHGGPLTQYARTFMHEFYVLAAQGYVVVYSNPRGGTGYGEAHAGAIRGVWGTADYEDLMSFTDLVAAKPYVDEDRLGVCGGSYGGYMTGMIIGNTDRFKAAVAQRMVSNLVSFHGTSDFNWGVKHLIGVKTEPWNDLETYWKQSPMSLIGNVKTPTLVIHSEGDLRCAVEQGEQYFVALRLHGVDTELVLFPNENHGLSRGGRTDRRISRIEHNYGWFDRYLKPKPEGEA